MKICSGGIRVDSVMGTLQRRGKVWRALRGPPREVFFPQVHKSGQLRYERGSLMITSNLSFSKWERIFKEPMTTAAAIDRLVHHSIILELNLPSYRLEHSTAHKEVQKEGWILNDVYGGKPNGSDRV